VRVRERIEELLEDRDFRVQSSALEGLAVLGDAAAAAAIEHMAERELDGRLRRRSREVVRDLRDRASTADELVKLRDEIADLKSSTASMRERLDKLEARTSAKQAEKEARKAEKAARRAKKKKA
jgi:aminopeptidase N